MKRRCEICGFDEKKRIYRQRFVLPTKNYFHSGYDVVTCKNCGFAFADNIPGQTFFEKYYGEMSKKTFYMKAKIFKNNNNSNYNKEMNIRLQNSFDNFKEYVNKNDRILDVGCYTGELLQILKKNGYKRLLGIDPSDYAIETAKEKYGVNVIKASIFKNLTKLGKFDFIIINHVLEHIENLEKFLLKIKSLLKDDGKIYIETPDAGNFFISQSEKYLPEHQEPFQQFSVEHINYFTKISTSNLLNKMGMLKIKLNTNVSVISTINSIWTPMKNIKDELIGKKLGKYIIESKNLLADTEYQIKKINKKNKEIYVWGAGVHTQRLLSLTNLVKTKIRAFVDSNPSYHKATLIGRPIILPEMILNEKSIPILISTKGYQEDIIKRIKKMGLKNEVITLYD